jgi:AAA15 family ATPase/GTPase
VQNKTLQDEILLNWIEIENFRSIEENCLVNFSLSSKSARSDLDCTLPAGGMRVSGVAALFGPNQSGKRNVLDVVRFIAQFSCGTGLSDNFKTSDVVQSYFYKDSPCKLAMNFLLPPSTLLKSQSAMDFIIYYEFHNGLLMKETLKVKVDSGHRAIYTRKMDHSTGKSKIRASRDLLSIPGAMLNSVRPNQSLLSLIYEQEKNLTGDSSLYGLLAGDFFNALVEGSFINKPTSDEILSSLCNQLSKSKRLSKDLSKLLLSATPLINEVKFINNIDTDTKSNQLLPAFVSVKRGVSVTTMITDMNSGAGALFITAAQIIIAKAKSKPVLLTTACNLIHPTTMSNLIQALNSDMKYPRCQILMSSYNLELLKILCKHHIFMVDMENESTDVIRLDRIRGLKDRDNFYSKYLEGVFNALPR